MFTVVTGCSASGGAPGQAAGASSEAGGSAGSSEPLVVHTGASGDIRPISLNGTGYRGEATATDDTHALTRFDEPPFVDGPHMPGRIWIVPDGPPAPGS